MTLNPLLGIYVEVGFEAIPPGLIAGRFFISSKGSYNYIASGVMEVAASETDLRSAAGSGIKPFSVK